MPLIHLIIATAELTGYRSMDARTAPLTDVSGSLETLLRVRTKIYSIVQNDVPADYTNGGHCWCCSRLFALKQEVEIGDAVHYCSHSSLISLFS